MDIIIVQFSHLLSAPPIDIIIVKFYHYHQSSNKTISLLTSSSLVLYHYDSHHQPLSIIIAIISLTEFTHKWFLHVAQRKGNSQWLI